MFYVNVIVLYEVGVAVWQVDNLYVKDIFDLIILTTATVSTVRWCWLSDGPDVTTDNDDLLQKC